MKTAFRILTYLLAGMGCAFAGAHITAPPVTFVPEIVWQLFSVLTWGALWLVYLFAAANTAIHCIPKMRHSPA